MWILGHKGLGTGAHRFGSCVAFPFFPFFFLLRFPRQQWLRLTANYLAVVFRLCLPSTS